MRRITLRTTSLQTSQLGFGCAGLTALNDRGKAIALLEQALELGITHFDSAPAYGFGQSEGMLGEFLSGKRDRVTVTTKFGLQINPAAAKHARLLSFARRTAHALPMLRKLGKRAAGSLVQGGVFSPADAQASLEKSLVTLRTDHVDLFLLHEANRADAQREDLLAFLDAQAARGTIRHYGVAGGFHRLGDDLRTFTASHRVFQFDAGPGGAHVAQLAGSAERGLILFGVIGMLAWLLGAARIDEARTREWSESLGEDLADAAALRRLLLHSAAASVNDQGIILLGTRSPQHLRENVLALDSPPPPAETLTRFNDYVRRVLT